MNKSKIIRNVDEYNGQSKPIINKKWIAITLKTYKMIRECEIGKMKDTYSDVIKKLVIYYNSEGKKRTGLKRKPQQCACGCGEMAKPGNKYIIGHNLHKMTYKICECCKKKFTKEDIRKSLPAEKQNNANKIWKLRKCCSDECVKNYRRSLPITHEAYKMICECKIGQMRDTFSDVIKKLVIYYNSEMQSM